MPMNKIHSCEVCGSNQLRPVLDLGKHPMCDDLVEVGSSRVCMEYPISILYCDTCFTAHQQYQIDKHELFPSTYHYRSRHTADVLNGMRDLVAACGETVGDLSGKKVLDIGCNDGSLLSFYKAEGAKTFGIEPTDAALEARQAGHTVVQDYFSPESAESFVAANGTADIVTFTNVFAHIEDLKAVIVALKTVTDPRSLIVIENHYLGAILDRNQFDTFYHEHPRTYSLESFRHIAAALGRRIVRAEFPQRYGGNIRVFLGDGQPVSTETMNVDESGFGEGLAALSAKVARWRDHKGAKIERLVAQHGPLSGKAFPGRSAIPVKLLNLDVDSVARVHEKPSSAKIGHFIPATRIPIVSDDSFDLTSTKPLLNLAWHISTEISSYMRQRGFQGEIVDIISPDDF
jgi:SAM-dependent methyltransferase